jgi:hypothetical protein
VPRLVFFEQIRQQSIGPDEGVVRTGYVVTVLDEDYAGRHICVFGELIETCRDVGFEV